MGAADIFGTDRFVRYQAELQVRERLTGGVPKDPETIKKWLKSRLEMEDRALIELATETHAAMVGEDGERPTTDELLDALSGQVEAGNGFKRMDGQLVYEGRCLKAGLKEAANVAYPGTNFPGKPKDVRKGLMRYLAERVFVEEDGIPLGVDAPTLTEQRVKHIMTPQGPRSAINVVDIVEKPRLTATIAVLDDCLPAEVWGSIWVALEEIGIGADRARSDGKFDLVRWDRLPG